MVHLSPTNRHNSNGNNHKGKQSFVCIIYLDELDYRILSIVASSFCFFSSDLRFHIHNTFNFTATLLYNCTLCALFAFILYFLRKVRLIWKHYWNWIRRRKTIFFLLFPFKQNYAVKLVIWYSQVFNDNRTTVFMCSMNKGEEATDKLKILHTRMKNYHIFTNRKAFIWFVRAKKMGKFQKLNCCQVNYGSICLWTLNTTNSSMLTPRCSAILSWCIAEKNETKTHYFTS